MVKCALIQIFIAEHKKECQAIISLNEQDKPFSVKTNCMLTLLKLRTSPHARQGPPP